MRFVLLTVLALMMAAPAFAQAQKDREYRRFYEELSDVNRFQVLQRAEYDKAGDILESTVEDSTNRVVGDVQDLLLTDNGSIEAVNVEFDRLALRQPVFLNYREQRIEPVSTGYRMRVTDDEIKEIYPELLAGIATASGAEDGVFSVKGLIGARVESVDGRRLGKVEEVLFRSLGSRADLLYVSMDYGTLRDRGLAVPFEMVEYRGSGRRSLVLVDENQADAMIDYAKKN